MASNHEEKLEQIASYTLNDGHKIPILGFGTYQLYGKLCTEAIEHALSIGYRHIDTAIFYNNEKAIAEGIKNSKIDRNKLYITTKLWSDGHETGNGETYDAVNSSLKNLNTDYIDLYLIHSPHGGNNILTYKELLKCKDKGLIKSVGVSNYGVQHLKALANSGCPAPAVNQLELHPWLQQKDIVKYCQENNILIESYSPLTKGQKLKRLNKQLQQMVGRYKDKTMAQVLLKWNVQRGNVVLAKSRNNQRIEQNFDILNWKLSNDDMNVLNGLDCDYHCTWDPTTSEIINDSW